MIVSTTDEIAGKTITSTLGLVKGSTIRAKWFGKDMIAGLRQIVGGELKEYTQMLIEARDESTSRMLKEAEGLGADAVVAVRYQTSMVMAGSAEILAYGTAVKLS
ncbi:MAG: heavy metal-binding domain-containing protein [Nanohaloarchaea archaeon]|nr:heavy metal-binding domain-containing protein [Candidatus Nanohaloarchaea archaeon]